MQLEKYGNLTQDITSNEQMSILIGLELTSQYEIDEYNNIMRGHVMYKTVDADIRDFHDVAKKFNLVEVFGWVHYFGGEGDIAYAINEEAAKEFNEVMTYDIKTSTITIKSW